MVHGDRLHGTRRSTLLIGSGLANVCLGVGIRPCCGGLQEKGTANSPFSTAKSIIHYAPRFCKRFFTGRACAA